MHAVNFTPSFQLALWLIIFLLLPPAALLLFKHAAVIKTIGVVILIFSAVIYHWLLWSWTVTNFTLYNVNCVIRGGWSNRDIESDGSDLMW